MEYGKFIGQLVITAIIASILISFTSWIIGAISPVMGIFSSFITAVISVVFFLWAMKINPGKEEFLTSIPQVILAIAIVELIRNWITVIPTLTIPFNWIGLAFGLGNVFLANMIVKGYILK